LGATGTATLDFGAFPGASDASVTVTGQTGIGAGSLVEAWIFPANTADHTSTEHMVETFRVFAADIVAGTGFTIYGFNTSQLNDSLDIVGSGRSATGIVGAQTSATEPSEGGIGTRIYGAWNIAWVWS
jgi:hypothetical protein